MVFVHNYLTFFISLAIISLLSFFITLSIIKKSTLSFLLVLCKFSLFTIYFVIWSHFSPVTLIDDQTYFQDSLEVFDQAETFRFLFSKEGLAYLGSLAGGWHIGYYIYNVIAFYLFGASYYAPVLLNILFSVCTAFLFYKTLLVAGVERKFSLFAFVFFMLHWDIMSWSSFINLKDTFVLFLTMAALFNLIKMKVKGFNLMNLFCLLAILLIFQVIRFYFIYFLLVTAIVYILLVKMDKVKSRWKGFIMKCGLFFVLPLGFYVVFLYAFANQLATLGAKSNVVFGMVRYMLTPLPFNIDPDYSFITVASLLHWLFIPIAVYGLYIFTKRHYKNLMPFLIMALLLTVFYGSFSELQGPRHRIGILGFIALIQALGLWEILKVIGSAPRARLGNS